MGTLPGKQKRSFQSEGLWGDLFTGKDLIVIESQRNPFKLKTKKQIGEIPKIHIGNIIRGAEEFSLAPIFCLH